MDSQSQKFLFDFIWTFDWACQITMNTILERILLLNNIDIENLLPEILKLLKLDNDKSMSVLEHPDGLGNVRQMFI